MPIQGYRRALVTGASSGIGAAVTRALAARGLEVHALARRRDRLSELAGATGCTVHAVDVRDTSALRETIADLDIDVVVNNAGVGRGLEPLFLADPDDIDTTIDTNVRAVFHVLRAVLPAMVERKRGHVVNIGSMAGLYALKSSVYGASKAAVYMLSRNLRLELQGTGVKLTEILPGRVATEFYDKAIDDAESRDRLKDSGITELEPDDIAAAIVYALDTPWNVNVNLIELQPTEQTYGGSQFIPVQGRS